VRSGKLCLVEASRVIDLLRARAERAARPTAPGVAGADPSGTAAVLAAIGRRLVG
jgi:hypothetical protein